MFLLYLLFLSNSIFLFSLCLSVPLISIISLSVLSVSVLSASLCSLCISLFSLRLSVLPVSVCSLRVCLFSMYGFCMPTEPLQPCASSLRFARSCGTTWRSCPRLDTFRPSPSSPHSSSFCPGQFCTVSLFGHCQVSFVLCLCLVTARSVLHCVSVWSLPGQFCTVSLFDHCLVSFVLCLFDHCLVSFVLCLCLITAWSVLYCVSV